MSGDWRANVLKFWFGLEPEQWWNGGPELDHLIKQDFFPLWLEKQQLPVETFLTDPLTALAAVILFDQFPRNMFRGHADAYSTDVNALAIAKDALARGFDKDLARDERKFLYMPFMHSERLEDLNRAVLLFTELGDDHQLGYAKHHRDIVEKFGRFPHRNAILGRASRPEEIAAGADKPW
ncbi:MAG: DUF924 domain-containing protein [Sphingomonas sp.]|nr:DUF924 domain-containing protein [Sphingomonas sp.]